MFGNKPWLFVKLHYDCNYQLNRLLRDKAKTFVNFYNYRKIWFLVWNFELKIYAIIPSGGIGKRINNPLPKQYIKFHGKELIVYTLQIFQQCEQIDEIIVAAKVSFIHLIEEIKNKYGISKLTHIVEGGVERQHSVFNAVKSLNAKDDDIILVHDAVRPLISQKIITESIATTKKYGASVVAIKAKDTLIKGNDIVQSYVDRNEIYYAQTPQTFRYNIFMKAMKKAEEENFVGTDESMLVHRTGYKVHIIQGSSLNVKITSDDDLKLFEIFSENM